MVMVVVVVVVVETGDWGGYWVGLGRCLKGTGYTGILSATVPSTSCRVHPRARGLTLPPYLFLASGNLKDFRFALFGDNCGEGCNCNPKSVAKGDVMH